MKPRVPAWQRIVVALIGAAASLAASSAETPFLAENDAAMKKMMAGMEIKPPLVAIENEVAAKLIVDPPLPEPLARRRGGSGGSGRNGRKDCVLRLDGRTACRLTHWLR